MSRRVGLRYIQSVVAKKPIKKWKGSEDTRYRSGSIYEQPKMAFMHSNCGNIKDFWRMAFAHSNSAVVQAEILMAFVHANAGCILAPSA